MQLTSPLLETADDLYSRRGEGGAIESLIDILGQQSTSDFAAQWRLARAHFFLGQESELRPAKRAHHALGTRAGNQAAALESARVEGHFWYGVNLALMAEISFPLRAVPRLFLARSELRRAVSIDEAYHGAGPLRVLARLLHRSPRLLGGNRRTAARLYDRALGLAPTNSVTLLYAAELALDEGNRGRAMELLVRLRDSSVDEEWKYEWRRDRLRALALLDRVGA